MKNELSTLEFVLGVVFFLLLFLVLGCSRENEVNKTKDLDKAIQSLHFQTEYLRCTVDIVSDKNLEANRAKKRGLGFTTPEQVEVFVDALILECLERKYELNG